MILQHLPFLLLFASLSFPSTNAVPTDVAFEKPVPLHQVHSVLHIRRHATTIHNGRKINFKLISRAPKNQHCCKDGKQAKKECQGIWKSDECKCNPCKKGEHADNTKSFCLKDGEDCPGDQTKTDKTGCVCKDDTKKVNDGNGKCDLDNDSCPDDQELGLDKRCSCKDKKLVPDRVTGRCEVSDKKGQCKDGQILDPAEGYQDKSKKNPVCIDDRDSKCPKGQIAPSPSDDDRTNPNPACGKEPDEKDKAKCKNGEYVFVTVSDGNAHESCKKTREFDNKKKDKAKSILDDRAKKRKHDDDEKKKKQKDFDDKKKNRMSKCLLYVPLGMSDLKVYEVSPASWTTGFFTEEFIQDDDMLSNKTWFPWDEDNVPFSLDPPKEHDPFQNDTYMALWVSLATEQGDPVTFGPCSKRNLFSGSDKRCQKTRDVDPGSTGDRLEKRWEWLAALIAWFYRLGSRIASALKGIVGRLREPFKKVFKSDRFLKLADKNKGASRDAMQKARKFITEDKRWKDCIAGKEPTKPLPKIS
ncbi:hypothetical protein BU16DRAFT_541363 [Lophium mytilinum]|uniref:Uncharacterized protein n=1 Tax=Lophium mytilinum TaxID=390894 RepID=A0A6A6QKI0_9PEZI|nr:hypothetical protein BU16DRAFT_541363 [Lophium mytilinum]